MKHLFSLLLFFLPALLWAQDVDSTAIRQVDSLLQVSRTHRRQRDFDRALEVNTAAQKLALEKLGRESAQYGACCSIRGSIFYSKGDYPNAEKWFLESIDIQSRAVGIGKEHPDYATNLNSLGSLYTNMGKYEKVELLFLEATDILRKALGKEHRDYGWSLTNLANWYSTMGNYAKAEPLYLQIKNIMEKTFGKEHPEYAMSLINLADLYLCLGDYEKAELFNLEAIGILKMVDEEIYLYAASLEALGILYERMGNYEKVEPLYIEVKTIREKILGKEHFNYGGILNNLASLYKKMGNYEKAEPLNLEAIAILEKAFGKEHADYAWSLTNLANLYEIQNRFSASEPLLVELSALGQARLLRATSYLSERELAQYTTTFQKIGDNLGSYILARPPGKTTGALPAQAFGHALFQKGFLRTSAVQLNTLSVASPESEEINLRLKGYRRRLAAEYARPIAERKGVAELEEKANAAEKELARTAVGYAEAIRQLTWQEVQLTLGKDEAAIEFVHFRVNFPQKTDSIMYAALVLRPEDAQPHFIPLFEEKQLDSLLQTQGERRADYVNSLYSLAERGAKPLGKPQKTLYELLWQRLEKELAGVKTIYFSPSGLLHRLNLGAIPISEEETLSDRYQLVEMGSTRQLVVPHPLVNSEKTAMLFGGIQYEMDSTAMAQANLSHGSGELLASRGTLSFANADSTLRGAAWSYLKWTDKEVTALEPILKTAGIQASTRKGFAATEESFKAIGTGRPSPRILHIATHGYFFPDPKNAPSTGQGLGGEAELVFKISDHPMLRSGLILAGGNAAWQGAKTLEGREDGILTAYEISQMNLSNTELVVLSACETGLGDIQGNEGVYGLQRAFKIAGAKYLVMSLWQVPDQETSVFMTTFYKNWLEGKMTIPDAFRTTQQEMRERFINPYQWAGFVLVE